MTVKKYSKDNEF